MNDFPGLGVLIASNGRPVSMEWALSLATFQYPIGMSVAWFLCTDTDRARQREALMQRALDMKTEFVFWLDDDTVIPNYAIQQLHYTLNQHPDAGICGGIYCTKTPVPEPLVFMELGGGPYWNWNAGEIFECKGLGTGCMMIRTSILKDIPKPWFFEEDVAPAGETVNVWGEDATLAKRSGTDDLYFCRKVTEAGYKILAHGGVLPIHIGQDGKQYALLEDSYPLRKHREKIKAALASGKRDIVIEG